MAKETAFENGRVSNFEGLVTLTLDGVILHTAVHHSSTSSYIPPNVNEIKETFCGRMGVCMDGHLRLALLGQLCRRVDLITVRELANQRVHGKRPLKLRLTTDVSMTEAMSVQMRRRLFYLNIVSTYSFTVLFSAYCRCRWRINSPTLSSMNKSKFSHHSSFYSVNENN